MAPVIPSIRTPSPPADRDTPIAPEDGIASSTIYDENALSPMSGTFPKTQYASLGETLDTARGPMSPTRSWGGLYSPATAGSESEAASAASAETARNPFNFQTQQYVASRPPAAKQSAAEFGRRRGHKYARSSISHQIILSPTPTRTPLQLPQSLPIPTFKEIRASFTNNQILRLVWCFCHLFVAGYVQTVACGSLSMTALSHVLFFDALGAFLCVAVDIGRNFEVWQRTSIRHPFGLERTEVMAGLAMAIILLFMGLDLISHGATHALENKGGHEAHHAHSHERVSPGSVDIAALSAILSTLVSALSLGNHARIGRTLQISLPDFLPKALRNPSHLLTLGCSSLLLLLPLLSIQTYGWFDASLAVTMALAMVSLGGRLCYALGRMLLMSSPFPPIETQSLVDDITASPDVSEVEEARVWQVHYGLCMANFKIRVKSMENVERVRERISSLVKNRLGGGYGEGSRGVRWEINVQASLGRAQIG